jgi:hypothetical protein
MLLEPRFLSNRYNWNLNRHPVQLNTSIKKICGCDCFYRQRRVDRTSDERVFERVSQLQLPAGYTLQLAGEAESEKDAFGEAL